MLPAPTPQEKILQRVLFISAADGWSVVMIAALGALASLAFGDLSGVGIGALVLAAGVIELRGRKKLRRRDPSGMILLVRAQLFLLAVILVYCVTRLGSFDADTMMANLTPDMQAALTEAGIKRADVVPLVKTAFYVGYGTVAIVSILFQGGLALYYRNRKAVVTEALASPPAHVPPPL
jgi:hypothetical protein